MHSTFNTSLVITVIIILVVGCNKTPQNDVPNALSPKPGTEYKHGAKIIVQYLPNKDETTIYQQDFNIRPALTINQKALNGKHSFDFSNMGTYPSKTPKCVNDTLALTLTHTIKSKSEWHFEPKTKAFVMVDGNRLDISIYNQRDVEKEKGEFWESLIISPTCELYGKIGGAKAVEFHIGQGSFSLSEENILAFKDFANHIGAYIQ